LKLSTILRHCYIIKKEAKMHNPFQQTGSDSMSGLNDPLGFVKKLWGDMQLPGMVTPTLSVDELDKQIRDLKTVETWLTVNMNMLRGTIQALEVQRATISALKAMGESFSHATAEHSSGKPAAEAKKANSHGWPMPEPTLEENAEEDEEEIDEDEADAPAEVKSSEKSLSAEKVVLEKKEAPTDSANFQNPAGWWNVLQDQFKQALGQAMKDEEKPVANAKAASKKQAKPRKSSAPKPVSKLKAKPASAKQTAAKVTKPAPVSAKPAKDSKSTSRKPAAKAGASAQAGTRRRIG
jgi:hypothetical protein